MGWQATKTWGQTARTLSLDLQQKVNGALHQGPQLGATAGEVIVDPRQFALQADLGILPGIVGSVEQCPATSYSRATINSGAKA